jgi:hypothetical protein
VTKAVPARRRLFAVAVLAGLLLVCEGGAWVTHWAVEGRGFSYSRAGRQRGGVPRVEARGGASAEFHVEIHPYLGFAYSADWTGRLHAEAPITDWGFTDPRGRSPVRQRGPNKVVIAILGGSVASIFAHTGTTAFQRELKKSPHYAGKQIEFVSLAVGAYKQPQQLLALNYALALGAEFDEAVNIDGFNELFLFPRDNAASGVSVHYPAGWHWLATRMPDQEVRRRVGQIACRAESRARWAEVFGRAPLRWSVTAHLVWRARDRWLKAEMTRTEMALRAAGQAGLPHKGRGPRNTYRDDREMLVQLVSNWERGSLLLCRTCLAHGIRYHHFLQPNQYVPGSKPLSAQEKRVAILEKLPGRAYIEKGYPLLRQAGARLRGQGARFHDLSGVFAHSKDTFYTDTCCHFNQAGNEVLAVAVAAAMLETPEPPVAEALTREGGRP